MSRKTVIKGTVMPQINDLSKPMKRAFVKLYKKNGVFTRKQLIEEIVERQCSVATEIKERKGANGSSLLEHMIDLTLSTMVKNQCVFRVERGVYTLTDEMFEQLA